MKIIISVLALIASTSSFAQTAIINGNPVSLLTSDVIPTQNCDTFECRLDMLNISYATSDFENIWVSKSIDASMVCDVARDMNIENSIRITLIEGTDITPGACE